MAVKTKKKKPTQTQPLADVAKVNASPATATEELLAQPAAVPDPGMAIKKPPVTGNDFTVQGQPLDQQTFAERNLELESLQPTATEELLQPTGDTMQKMGVQQGQQMAAGAADEVPGTKTIEFGTPGGPGSGSFDVQTQPVQITLDDGTNLDLGELWQPPDGLDEQQIQQWNQGNQQIQELVQQFPTELAQAEQKLRDAALTDDIANQWVSQLREQMTQTVNSRIQNVQRQQQNLMQFNQIQGDAGIGGNTEVPTFEGVGGDADSIVNQILQENQGGGTQNADMTPKGEGGPGQMSPEDRDTSGGPGQLDPDDRDTTGPPQVPAEDAGGGASDTEGISEDIEGEAGVDVDTGTVPPTTDDNVTATDEGVTEPESAGTQFNTMMDELGDLFSGTELKPEDVENLGQNENVQKFIDNLLNSDPQLSEEEKNVIRMNTEKGMKAALSQLSARGMGRGSDAARMIIQGNIMAEYEIAREQNRVRTERVQQALQAAGIEASRESQRASNVFTFQGQEIQRDIANQNFFNATRAQNLAEVKNAQGFSLEQRALDQKDRMLALDEDKFNEAVREFGLEFGLALDAESFRQALETGEFNLSVIDSDRSYDIQQRMLTQELVTTLRGQDIEENLGISKLQLEAYLGGEELKREDVANMLHHLAINNQFDISMAEIELEIAKMEGEAEGSGFGLDDFFTDIVIPGIGAIWGPGGIAAGGAVGQAINPD